MVMSGRFDDVCAELDRLVALESAREAARHHH
jgi:DNA-binding SARP family transcriptional activator